MRLLVVVRSGFATKSKIVWVRFITNWDFLSFHKHFGKGSRLSQPIVKMLGVRVMYLRKIVNVI